MLTCFVSRIFAGQHRHARPVALCRLAALLILSLTAPSCQERPKELSSSILSQTQMATGSMAADAVQDADGGIVVVGSHVAAGSRNVDVYILRFGADARISWAKSFDLGGYDEAESVIAGQAGEFVVACYSKVCVKSGDPPGRVVLLGLDGDGNETFRVRPQLGRFSPVVAALAEVAVDEWVVVGSFSPPGPCQMWMYAARITREGTVAWEQDFRMEECEFQSFTEVVDIGKGLFMGVGWADFPRARGGRNACIVKFGADGREFARYLYEKPDTQDPQSAALLRNGVLIVASWCVGRVELLGLDLSGAVVFERLLDFADLHPRICEVDDLGCLLAFKRWYRPGLRFGVARVTDKGSVSWYSLLPLEGTLFPVFAAAAGHGAIVVVGSELVNLHSDKTRLERSRIFVATIGNLREGG